MASPIAQQIAASSRTIRDDGNGDLLGGLLAKAVLFADNEGRMLAGHCEVDRLRAWVGNLLQKTSRLLPGPLKDLVDEAVTTDRTVVRRELLLPLPEGPQRFHASATPSRLANGISAGVTIAIYDLSPVQELSHNLGQLVRLASIGTLAAGLAHEIKNALVAVNTFVDILVNKHQDTELAPIVAREIRRIDHIVGQMLRVSGPRRVEFQRVGIHELLEHALSVAQHRMAGNRILLVRKLEADPDIVLGDASQLEQAFVNLLFNAVEAMGSHGTLTATSSLIHREDGSPFLQLTIGDTGTGIPTESLGRIFEPFYSTKATGHGLGLVITRRIVLDHGGQIQVESKTGEGTTFSIELPSAARQP